MKRSIMQRQYPCSESLAIILKEAETQDINLKFKTADGCGTPLTYLCSANDNQFKYSLIGGGSSSDPEEAKAKAAYEAIEWSVVSRRVNWEWKSDWTGLGTGATREEAILHGINEWIERDGYAIFLLRCLVKDVPEKTRFIKKKSLSPELGDLVKAVENRFKEDILIVDVSTNFQIPAFLVSFTKQSFLVQPMGLGASPFKAEAFTQALFEAVQYRDRYGASIEEHRKEQLASLGDRPPLVQAFLCNLKGISESKNHIEISWDDLPENVTSTRLPDQINQLSLRLERNGHRMVFQDLFSGETGLSVVHTQIEGLETFYRIKEGVFTPPTPRGLELLK